jgi:hypothetical protein
MLEEYRGIVRGLIGNFEGKEISTVGDGFLLEFASALEATHCSVEIQRTISRRNETVRVTQPIEVRIGIHVGDIIKRKGDVLGDGVNVAARIQSAADTGGICVSQQVYDHIANKCDHPLLPMGARNLKNIVRETALYKVVFGSQASGLRVPDMRELVVYRHFVLQPLSRQLSRSTGKSLEAVFSCLCAAVSLAAFTHSLAPNLKKAPHLFTAIQADQALMSFLNDLRSQLQLAPFEGAKTK